MFKKLLKELLINGLCLGLTSIFFSGLEIDFSLQTFLITSLLLTLILKFIKPIFDLILLPIHLLTFGLLRFLRMTLSLGLLIYLSDNLTLGKFYFAGWQWGAFKLSSFTASPMLSLLISSIIFYWLQKIVWWIIKTR